MDDYVEDGSSSGVGEEHGLASTISNGKVTSASAPVAAAARAQRPPRGFGISLAWMVIDGLLSLVSRLSAAMDDGPSQFSQTWTVRKTRIFLT